MMVDTYINRTAIGWRIPDVENQAFIFSAKEGKTFRGICLAICGQAYVFGASLRGFYWRFGAAICTPKPGYSESIFAIRSKLVIKAGMIDELVPVRVRSFSASGNRNIRVHSIIHTSKSGLLTMSFRAMDATAFPSINSKSLEGFAEPGTGNLDEYYDGYEGRDELDSD
jgi:hypothetical protein